MDEQQTFSVPNGIFVNAHTHQSMGVQSGEWAVVNCEPEAFSAENFRGAANGLWASVGIHPWTVDENWRERMPLLERICEEKCVVAVGECGLDKAKGGDWAEQLACLEAQVALAKRVGKPLIIHCVRAWDDILRLCRGIPAVIHGFRGKAPLAKQLLDSGFDLSFGPKFQSESLRLAFERRKMWLETDDAAVGIAEVYELASRALSISATDIPVPGTLRLGAISASGASTNLRSAK